MIYESFGRDLEILIYILVKLAADLAYRSDED
jgi:hypothetical protein